MQHSDSLVNIAPALIAVQGSIQPVPLDGINDEVGGNQVHKYSSFTAMWKVARAALQANEIVMTQGGEGSHSAEYVEITTRLIHKSGEWISDTITVPLSSNCPQDAGAAITRAKRYGLGAMLGMVSEVDDDAMELKRKAAEARKERLQSNHAHQPAPQPAEKPKPVDTRTPEEQYEAAMKALNDLANKLKANPLDRSQTLIDAKTIVMYSKDANRCSITPVGQQQLADFVREHIGEIHE